MKNNNNNKEKQGGVAYHFSVGEAGLSHDGICGDLSTGSVGIGVVHRMSRSSMTTHPHPFTCKENPLKARDDERSGQFERVQRFCIHVSVFPRQLEQAKEHGIWREWDENWK